ncbi:MAG TPA: hypothetical protein VEB42_02510, partial [Chitinophagaceae bacterium]|nr:hypothetical protein [Chitinophagaceae bacterium]
MKNLVIALYSQPEYYPPTLSALEYLSAEYDNIYFVHRNYITFDWVYPPNVHMIPSGKLVHVRDAEAWGIKRKVKEFIAFTNLLRKTIKQHGAHTLLIYDPMPVLSYRFISKMIKKPHVLWYHNHDVAEGSYLRKYSLGWLAWKSEKWIFPKLDIFSLPAVERRVYFSMNKLKGKFFFLPNFPSKKIYDRFRPSGKPTNLLKILYQGSIGPLHGLEEIIPLLNSNINGRELQLVLKGFINDEYFGLLKKIAMASGTLER